MFMVRIAELFNVQLLFSCEVKRPNAIRVNMPSSFCSVGEYFAIINAIERLTNNLWNICHVLLSLAIQPVTICNRLADRGEGVFSNLKRLVRVDRSVVYACHETIL